MPSLKDIKPAVNIKEFLTEQGVDFIDRGDWIMMSCLFSDHEDSNPSFSINVVNYGFNCYGCQRHGTWVELCDELGWDGYTAAEEFLTSNYTYEQHQDALKRLDMNVDGLNTDMLEGRWRKPIGFRYIENTDPQYEYLKKRKLHKCIEKFKLGVTTDMDIDYGKNYLHRVIVPVHSYKGRYLWCEGRYIYKAEFKKYFRPSGVKKELVLFNLHRVLKQKWDWVVVNEGVFDTMTLWNWNTPAVCVFGATMSDLQLYTLVASFDKIYLCYDTDRAGLNAVFGEGDRYGIKDRISSLGVSIYRIVMPRGKDVNKVSKAEFEKIFYRARRIW